MRRGCRVTSLRSALVPALALPLALVGARVFDIAPASGTSLSSIANRAARAAANTLRRAG